MKRFIHFYLLILLWLVVFTTNLQAFTYERIGEFGSVYYQLHNAITHTGTTTATLIHSKIIEGGKLTENGTVVIITGWEYDQNDADTKTCAVMAGGTVLTTINGANNRSSRVFTSLHNVNSYASQIAPPSGIQGFGNSTATMQTLSINTLQTWTIDWYATLADATDSVKLRFVEMWIYP